MGREESEIETCIQEKYKKGLLLFMQGKLARQVTKGTYS